MFENIVTFYIHQGGALPTNDALAYQYVLAATGLHLRAENRFFDVLLPISRCNIRGLASLKSHFRLKVPRLPGRLLAAVLADAQRMRRPDGGLNEALYHFRHDGGVARLAQGAGIRVVKPPQRAGAAIVVGAESRAADVLLDLHSHGNMAAFWSATDDGDEQGFRAYGVIGRLDTAPEIRLRLGVYGYRFPLPADVLFDDAGGFTDVYGREKRLAKSEVKYVRDV